MRIVVPSWVIPGTYAENLRFLRDKVAIDGVELLFFIYDAEVRRQLDAEFDLISAFSARFAYSVHLPDPLLAAHESLVARLAPLAQTFIVHPAETDACAAQAALLASWQRRYGGQTPLFLIENTQPGRLEAYLAQQPDAALCLDTGHLLLEGTAPAEYCRTHADRIAEIHLHGLDPDAARLDGRLVDHRPIRPDAPWFVDLVPYLRRFAGRVNIEVFSWAEVQTTVATLRYWQLIPPEDAQP